MYKKIIGNSHGCSLQENAKPLLHLKHSERNTCWIWFPLFMRNDKIMFRHPVILRAANFLERMRKKKNIRDPGNQYHFPILAVIHPRTMNDLEADDIRRYKTTKTCLFFQKDWEYKSKILYTLDRKKLRNFSSSSFYEKYQKKFSQKLQKIF